MTHAVGRGGVVVIGLIGSAGALPMRPMRTIERLRDTIAPLMQKYLAGL